MTPTVRRVRPEDWPRTRAARLEALQDPAAPIAFLETYDVASGRPDDFWMDRATGASAGPAAAQFVAIGPDGDVVATVSGLREEPGTEDFSGARIETRQVHVVGVWLRPDQRGAGLLGRLVDEVAAWAAGHGVRRLRLLVHEDNDRARAAYVKLGFAETGTIVNLEAGREIEMARTS
jgi:ribosomal protein S18 acetylase RimI-like enzyme